MHTYITALMLLSCVIAGKKITFEEIQKMVDFKEILKVAPKWKQLGAVLNVPTDRVEFIMETTSFPEDCLQLILKEWFVKGSATWMGLVKALMNPDIDEQELAMRVLKSFCSVGDDLLWSALPSGMHLYS